MAVALALQPAGLMSLRFGEPQRGEWWGHDGYGNAFMYAMDPNLVVTGTLDNAQADWGTMAEKVQSAFLE